MSNKAMFIEIKVKIETDENTLTACVKQEDGEAVIHLYQDEGFIMTLDKNQFIQWVAGVYIAIDGYERIEKQEREQTYTEPQRKE